MGIPAFFRWLQRKYPEMVEPVETYNLDPATRQAIWFDNLYLDMNNIIHPCTHPEDKPPPQTEEEMFEAIFEYTDKVIAMIRPRHLVFLAIDGVAPRAKMNQQRTRRFRAVQESELKRLEIEKVRAKLREKGIEPAKNVSASFDSNVITPGTEFMKNLSKALQKWISEKLTNLDDVWHKDLNVILSDSSVPGEGEHKIMDYLRKERASSHYNPNLRHCLYGADADLIMLGLATHETHFTILREEFKPFLPKPCDLCNHFGHKLAECQGAQSTENDKKMPQVGGTTPDYIMIKLYSLKEFLRRDMDQDSSVKLDFEKFIDDYIFLCFFVGNDFLPHLPCLDIRENAIDRLLGIYHTINHRSHGRHNQPYLTNNGVVNLEKCQEILNHLGNSEQNILMRRRRNDERYESRQLDNKRIKWNEDHPNGEPMPEPEPTPVDYVRLGDYGCKERYYNSKFGYYPYMELAKMLTKEYVRGLCWVLAYYYKGCPDWQWFYPYHYAPFAEDMHSVTTIKLDFNSRAPPFKPLEQLMAVFPEKSAGALPKTWRKLMSDPESPIIDFYPTDFKIDMNGKKQAYLGVALLPFIDEARLFRALKSVYPDLTEEEIHRNSYGEELKFSNKALVA